MILFCSAEVSQAHLLYFLFYFLELISPAKVSCAITHRLLSQITESQKAAIEIHLRKGPATEPKEKQTW